MSIEREKRDIGQPASTSRRRLLLYGSALAAGVVTGVGGGSLYCGKAASLPSRYQAADPLPANLLPVSAAMHEMLPALAKWYPHLNYLAGSSAPIQIANAGHPGFPAIHPAGHVGIPGNCLYRIGENPDRFLIPWVSLFPKATPYLEAPQIIQQRYDASSFHIKDEGSNQLALFGNKARKYEYSLPNAALSGTRSLFTFGSLGSNHCSFLTLAARYGDYRPVGHTRDRMSVVLNLYPQQVTDAVIDKLRLMLALGAQMRFLENDMQVGLSILGARMNEKFMSGIPTAYFPPGGSNTLTVLGHIDAILELAEQIEETQGPIPDYIFVPLGSGATAVGLMLGCYLLGWPTKVVGTTTQDKSAITRLIVNGDVTSPFLVANSQQLLEAAVQLLNEMKIKPRSGQPLKADLVIRHNAEYDNTTWRPAYGVASRQVMEAIALAGEAGIALDTTFSGKAFSTLTSYAESGRLKNKHVLFWNTHHRFDFTKLPGFARIDLAALPEALQEKIFDFTTHAKRTSS